jgi:hypothetical protein
MRKTFEIQYELGATPIEKIKIPMRSRDELPPVLRALQYIYTTPELNRQVFSLLTQKIKAGVQQTGRYGMSLWEILVFSVVRLTLDCNYDRLEHIANYDNLVRQLLGICNFGDNLKRYSLQSLKDNVRLLDEATLDKINALVVGQGHGQQLKKTDDLNVRIDSYVLETNVHFPTDLNLLYDAGRKSIELMAQLCEIFELPGWRKFKNWRKQLKRAYHKAAKTNRGAGIGTDKGMTTASHYLSLARSLHEKVANSLAIIRDLNQALWPHHQALVAELSYFHNHLNKHIDLVYRRLMLGQSIQHDEKVFSLFEPHTEWISKGKAGTPVELGLRIAVATDQFGFILGYRVMQQEQDVDIAVPFAQQLLKRYSIASLSFDKGFWSRPNYQQLKSLVSLLVMPKKGKLSQSDKEREYSKTFQQLRHQHAAVESAIHCLEHHGLNRCPDKGMKSYRRYTALGVLAYNLHKLGNILLTQDRQELVNAMSPGSIVTTGLSKAA